jgi:hypothetical protein
MLGDLTSGTGPPREGEQLMTEPFEDADRACRVLTSPDDQVSLTVALPADG